MGALQLGLLWSWHAMDEVLLQIHVSLFQSLLWHSRPQYDGVAFTTLLEVLAREAMGTNIQAQRHFQSFYHFQLAQPVLYMNIIIQENNFVSLYVHSPWGS